ncbi:DUF4292 domain-containing protein [Mucilaginibacter myungsuensis]|uniref:DUF4292 domain-containing protein n=1 Tax=Mucilaginibacter myungsuensis TaxID=649104 RepID=A0A929L4V7_9SPHI|nr:DUF4292 domain-containing protein [Mucilaginibacter myungsuensis]MBE9663271.1 DUF4292 domain-containing protein [Mucilaginibacter myungsuensis]MDN3600006.1 DUF4292 domain-containing protein [Mucilaginibacter myungsuensis]
MNKITTIIFCSFVALAGCKAKKQVLVNREAVKEPVTVKAAPSTNAKLIAIRERQVNFNTFNGKAKARLDIDGDDNDVTLTIRIDRDKKIWVSVVTQILVNIEVARALITPDSIIVLNKLQGLYMKKPFSYVHQYGGKQVNFKTLQALLIGNAMPELLHDGVSMSEDGANTLLNGQLGDIGYKLNIGADYKVSQSNLTNNLAALTLQVINGAFIQADGRVIPSQIDITSTADKKNIKINMRYTNAEFDKPIDTPFSIPDSYKAAN